MASYRSDPHSVLADLADLGLPVFVKPAHLGSSVGIVKVTAAAELDGALRAAFAHDGLAIVEAMAGGVEVECGVLGLPDSSSLEGLAATRLRARGDRARRATSTTTRRSTRPAGWS